MDFRRVRHNKTPFLLFLSRFLYLKVVSLNAGFYLRKPDFRPYNLKKMPDKETSNSKYTIDLSRNLCEVHVEGNDNLDTILERYNSILNDEEWCCGMNVIVDITKVRKLTLSGQDLEILGYHHRRLADKLGIGIWCFVANSGFLYGIWRIFEFWADPRGQKVHVCRSREEAVKKVGNQT
jgi:hypothetical protein